MTQTQMSGALVSWFRSRQYHRYHDANFETKTTLGINKLLVSLDSEIRIEPDMEIERVSESGH
jgi:hypothetical protein